MGERLVHDHFHFAMSYVVDMLHTSHQKVTALIITTKAESVGKNISKHVFRGMTLLPSVGGYSGVPGNMIMMVVTRYEIYDLEQAVLEADENAFINFVPTQSITGRFATDDEQRTFKTTGVFPELKVNKRIVPKENESESVIYKGIKTSYDLNRSSKEVSTMPYTEAESEAIKERVLAALETVIDPELGIDIVNLGLIYEIEFDGETGDTVIKMTLTTMGCPLADVLTEQIHEALSDIPEVKNPEVKLVWYPAWTTDKNEPLCTDRVGDSLGDLLIPMQRLLVS